MDNIRVVADGLTSTTTYAYDKVNELTRVTRDGADIVYTYDDWGRTISKNMQSGAHVTIYTYKYGDKLKRIGSTFSDESVLPPAFPSTTATPATAPSLYYTPYRYYLPGNAKWTTKDLLGMVDGPNMYGYVRENPIGHKDLRWTRTPPRFYR